MIDLKKSLRRFAGLNRPSVRTSLSGKAVFSPGSLKEIHKFASNPGNLRMFTYLPARPSASLPLVVVLHGCTQTAAGYNHGAGWSTLADRYGFALLMPEQQRTNNHNGCFNWFLPDHTQRERGEAASIRQMVAAMIGENGIDPERVFITGLSAGGAMTSVMLACYPEVFAGGAIIAGLPYGAANNVQQAFASMFQCPTRSGREWGDLVRRASQHDGPWPRISVWHGGGDKTVVPANAQEIVKQWCNVHGLNDVKSVRSTVDGYPRHVWRSDEGHEVIESFTIPQMSHGTPLATGIADFECGAAGPFMLDVGISSSYHIAKFFGLTQGANSASSSPQEAAPAHTKTLKTSEPPQSLQGEVPSRHAPVRRTAGTSRIDIGAVIAKALKAAGLTK